MTNTQRVALSSVALLLAFTASGSPPATAQSTAQAPQAVAGQSRTLLPDGSYLLLGGEAASGRAFVYNPADGTIRETSGLSSPRAWHTATVLPDGSVLVVGGVDAQGTLVGTAEQFDPRAGTLTVLNDVPFTPRARHSATVLTDGRLLLAGGDVAPGGLAAELWTPGEPSTSPTGTPLARARRHPRATMLPDGRVTLTSEEDRRAVEVFDPATDGFQESAQGIDGSLDVVAGSGFVAGSQPEDGATGVAIGTRVAIRFARRADVTSVNGRTVWIDGPEGRIEAAVVAAEEGQLAFVTPATALRNGADICRGHRRRPRLDTAAHTGDAVGVHDGGAFECLANGGSRRRGVVAGSIPVAKRRRRLALAPPAAAPGAAREHRAGGTGLAALGSPPGGGDAGDRRPVGRDRSQRTIPAHERAGRLARAGHRRPLGHSRAALRALRVRPHDRRWPDQHPAVHDLDAGARLGAGRAHSLADDP